MQIIPTSAATATASVAVESTMSLDSLLAESVAVFSLDDLLTESMALSKASAKVKESRSRLAMGQLHPEARAALQAEIRAHELKVEWKVEAAVAVFNRQYCSSCEFVHIHFEGFFQRQKHRTSKSERWVRAPKEQMLPNLPKETKYEESTAIACEECCGTAGYPIEE